MNELGHEKIKSFGQYYTPTYIVNYIISKTVGHLLENSHNNENESVKILDPACGLGIFLVYTLDFLLLHEEIRSVNFKTRIKNRRRIIANQLYGIDVDPTQIEQTLQNLGSDFNINLKVFNALLPPVWYHSQFNVTELKQIRKLVKEQHINEADMSLIEKNILKVNKIEKRFKKILIDRLKIEFNLSSNINPMIWDIVFPEVNEGFDIILGNPPWGADNSGLTSEILKKYSTGTQQVDTWSLFIERSIRNLKDNGRLGFIVPNTLLSNENYISVRKFILEHCCIISIVNLGGNVFPQVTQPCLIIVLEKGFSSKEENIEIIQNISQTTLKQLASGDLSLTSIPSITCSQMRFHENFEFEFDIFAIGYEEIISAIENDLHTDQIHVKPLSVLVKNARGVEINKKGRIIQCSLCKRWNSPPLRINLSGVKSKVCSNPDCDNKIKSSDREELIIFNEQKIPLRDKPYLVGHQVQRYYLHKHKYIDPNRKGIKYKKSSLYQGKKLLLRKTGQGIKIVIDYENRWVSQVIYIFKPRDNSPVSLEYLLGVLNSTLIQQYFYLKYTDRYRTDFPHFTQNKFLKIPIKIPNIDSEYHLAAEIQNSAKQLQSEYQSLFDKTPKMLDSSVANSTIKKLEKRINELVLRIYNITVLKDLPNKDIHSLL